jgi:hypothetical protein
MTKDNNTIRLCLNKRSKTIGHYSSIISYVDITIRWKQPRSSNIKTQVFAFTLFFTGSANNSNLKKRFAFIEGSNVKKLSSDEYDAENEMCAKFALQFIVEVLYKNISKVPTEVRHIKLFIVTLLY